ncbi:MAG: PAS domain S-box protein [Methanobacteriota archaeon]
MSENTNTHGCRRKGASKLSGCSAILLAILLSAVFWVIDINIDIYIFGEEGTFLSQLFSPEPFEIYFRVLVVSLIMGLGIINQIMISKARSSEYAMKQSETWVKSIFNALQTGVVVVDVETRTIVEANPVAVKMLGSGKKDIVGNRCYNFFHSGADNRCSVLDSGHSIDNSERILINKKGERVPILKNVVRATMNGREYLVESFVDLTERKVAEEILKTSRARLTQAMDLAHIVNWEFDVATGIFTFNDRFYAFYGTTAELEGGYQMPADVYSKGFVHPDDIHVVADEVHKAILTTDPGYVSQLEHRIIRRDGEVRHIVVRIGITKGEDGRTIKTHGANQDITERKKAELALYHANASLEARVSQSNEISRALINDIGIERAAGIIYESGWRIGLEEARPSRTTWKGDSKSFAEDFFERHAMMISLQAKLTEFYGPRHHARVGMFPVDRILDVNGAADAEMAYAHGFVAAVLSVAFGKPVGVKVVSAVQGNLVPSYEIETRELEPYEFKAYKLG